MTAIAGYWCFDGGGGAEPCGAMLDAMRPLGPDGNAQHDEAPLSLGRALFRRLPEDRLDTGPAFAAGGRLRLVGDIRLDDPVSLGRTLGVDEGAHSDASLTVLAFERWGEQALDRLYGDFALALWDDRRRRLLLARDATGQKPLHYHRGRGFFAFASMPRGLHALPEIERRADPAAIADFLGLVPESGSSSYFEGIGKVPAGHFIEVGCDRFEVRRWWRPSLEPVERGSPADHAEMLREALDSAVEARLRGAGRRLGSHLSAGLDSASVTATAAKILSGGGGRVVAYTAVPNREYSGGAIGGAIADEGPLAAEVASLYPNIDHVRLTGSDRSPLATLANNSRFYERPMLNVANMGWVEAIQDDARARGLTVLLNGASGNASLTYDGLHALPQLLARGHWLRLARFAWALHANGSRWTSLGARTVGPFLPKTLWRQLRRSRMQAEPAAGPLLGQGAHADLIRRAKERGIDPEAPPRRDAAQSRMETLAGMDPGNHNKGTLAGWGVEPRDPTADRALIELCLRIPITAWLEGGRPRGLARIAMSDRLPAAIVDEGRKGSQAADWHDAFDRTLPEMEAEVERIATCPEAAELLDVGAMRRLLEAWPTTDRRSRGAYHRYRQGLLRAVAAGHFIRCAGT